MMRSTLHEAIDSLPENELIELANYITYLQWKAQKPLRKQNATRSPEKSTIEPKGKVEKLPPYRPVAFPAGIIIGFDFSPEFIAQSRRELWGRLGANGL
jgi:hypothetical protein